MYPMYFLINSSRGIILSAKQGQGKFRAKSLFYLRMIINIFVCFQEACRKKVPTGDGDNAIGVTRQQSKNGSKKRTKPKGPVAKQLRKPTTTTSLRNSERSLPIKSARTVAKVGRRRTTYAASGATDAVSDNEAEKSDTEVDDDDNTEPESSSDGEEDSLTLADVKKGLGVKGKHASTAADSDDAATNGVREKSEGGRETTTKKEKSPSIDATSFDSDVSSGDTLVIKTNTENSSQEKLACDTQCAKLVDEGTSNEFRAARVSADNDEKPANVPSGQLTVESLDISNGSLQSEATISEESTSLISDGVNSTIFETESEKGSPVENDTESMTPTPSVDVSCHKDYVTPAEKKLSTQIEANKADTRPSAIGCCALEDEQVIGAATAAPHANKTTEETEPVNGKTAVAPLASMPTPDDADSANDMEDECAHGDANLPGEERNNEAAPATEQTHKDDDTEQDIAEVASSENRVEILRFVFADWRVVQQSNYNNLLNCVISVLHCDL